ncbi:MAG: cytidine deaminase [Clostridia bacterium]|nr:cytidine deaminase [Clostridia bacterium]
MKLCWQIDAPLEPAMLSLMQTAADQAARCEGIERLCAVSVRLCSDEQIRELNRDFRGIDRATDVLSFPLIRYPEGTTAGQADALVRGCYDDEADACMLGDLVISVEHLLAQAEEYGHSPAREAAYLLVHGLCHLFGYDHIEENDKRRMRAMEEKILSGIGQSRDEAAPVTDETLLVLAREAMERSYSPYSHFAVGAALLCEDGRVFQGCNVENASFGLTNCAERTAVFKAVSEGAREFTAIAIAAQGSAPWPCGACRQVLNEFAPGIRVLVTWDGKADEAPLQALLPHGFGPSELPDGKE